MGQPRNLLRLSFLHRARQFISTTGKSTNKNKILKIEGGRGPKDEVIKKRLGVNQGTPKKKSLDALGLTVNFLSASFKNATEMDILLLGCCSRFSCTLIKGFSQLAKFNPSHLMKELNNK